MHLYARIQKNFFILFTFLAFVHTYILFFNLRTQGQLFIYFFIYCIIYNLLINIIIVLFNIKFKYIEKRNFFFFFNIFNTRLLTLKIYLILIYFLFIYTLFYWQSLITIYHIKEVKNQSITSMCLNLSLIIKHELFVSIDKIIKIINKYTCKLL